MGCAIVRECGRSEVVAGTGVHVVVGLSGTVGICMAVLGDYLGFVIVFQVRVVESAVILTFSL